MSARIVLSEPLQRLTPDQPAWPPGLAALPDPPTALHLAGVLPDLTQAVAIVGTRFANDEALRFTRRLARELAAAGRVVISGGAAGIDAEAHRGALEVAGRTLAVLATGLVNAYPRQHAGLFAAIARSGGLVCEFADKPSGGGWLFLQRNRLIAALATTVVVVQAPYKSGALSTAHWAKSLSRRMLVVPASPWDEHGKGCLELLRGGAEICTSATDILLVPPFEARDRRKRARPRKELNHHAILAPCSRTVWKCVRCGVCHPDEIAATLDMPAAEVQEALLDLLLRGLCRQRADGGYVSDD